METTVPQVIREVLDALGLTYTDITEDMIAGQPVYQVVTDEKAFSSPQSAEVIRALDHLIKRIVEQRGLERANFVVDVNQYQIGRIREIEVKARMMADRARSFQYDVELAPMSAYERLIVHSILSDVPSVKTESLGEGRERRIVIRYIAEEGVSPSASDLTT